MGCFVVKTDGLILFFDFLKIQWRNFFYWELELESKFSSNLVSQVSDLLKQQQANITHQEDILEGQISAQRRSEKSARESQKELKEMIETLAHKLDEKSKKLMELHRQNLNLQEVLKEAANYSGMRERGVQRDNRSLSVNLTFLLKCPKDNIGVEMYVSFFIHQVLH